MKLLHRSIKFLIAYDRWRFRAVMRNIPGLRLDYRLNKAGIDVLKGVFIDREYADYFPFSESATIVDAGGHFGYFTLFAARHTAPDSRIFVLEPSPRNFRVLKKNLQRNKVENAVAFPMGMAGKTGTANLFLHANTYNDSTSSPSEKLEAVEVISLGDFLESRKISFVDFLKLDCEGAEYDILLNTPQEIFDKIKTISLEFHEVAPGGYTPNQLAIFLKQKGFQIAKFGYSRAYMDLNFGKMVATKLLLT